jgi:hypothetical protein
MRPTKWLMAAALCGVLLGSSTAWAGELLVGAEPLPVGDDGNITKDAKGKAVAEIESSVPGDEAWTLYIWAKIDNPAIGPIYLEFYRRHDGRELMAHRVPYEEYDGGKFLRMDVEITRNDGFKSGETLDVAFVQNVGGKDVKKAKGKITLLKSSKPMPKGEEADEDEDEEEEVDPNEAKEIAETPPEESTPPEVESGDKKGCTVGGIAMSPWLLLPVVGLRRRSARHAQP